MSAGNAQRRSKAPIPQVAALTQRNRAPVEPRELEDASLHVAQAASTVRMLGESRVADNEPDLQQALGLVSEYLHQCAEDLSELHRRSQLTEPQP